MFPCNIFATTLTPLRPAASRLATGDGLLHTTGAPPSLGRSDSTEDIDQSVQLSDDELALLLESGGFNIPQNHRLHSTTTTSTGSHPPPRHLDPLGEIGVVGGDHPLQHSQATQIPHSQRPQQQQQQQTTTTTATTTTTTDDEDDIPLTTLASRARLRVPSVVIDGSNLDAVIGVGAFRWICTCSRQIHDSADNIKKINNEEVQALLKSLEQPGSSGRHAGLCARSGSKPDDARIKGVARFLNSGEPCNGIMRQSSTVSSSLVNALLGNGGGNRFANPHHTRDSAGAADLGVGVAAATLLLDNTIPVPYHTLAELPIRVTEVRNAARLHVALGLTSVLQDVSRQPNSERAWWRLHSFPKLVMFPCKRSSAVNAAQEFARRCRMFNEHKYAELLVEAEASIHTPKAEADKEKRFQVLDGEDNALSRVGVETTVEDADEISEAVLRRSARLVRKGTVSRGVSALSAAKIAPHDLDTLAKLQALHPQASCINATESVRRAFVGISNHAITARELRKILGKFPPLSAAGLSGLTPGMLLFLICTPSCQTAANLAAEVVNLIIAGQVPEEARKYFFGARLIALEKKDGGIRPVACGDAFRRIAGKALASLALTKLDLRLHRQFAIGCSGGLDAIVQTFRGFIRNNRNDPDVGVLFVDFKNAFNNVSRQRLIEIVAARHPELLRYAALATTSTVLQFGKHVIASQQGVQQGDPLGGLFFCLVQDEVIKKCGVDMLDALGGPALGYLDDWTFGGKLEALAEYAAILRNTALEYGLIINDVKTILSAPADARIPDTLASFTRKGYADVTLLGVPIGTSVEAETLLAPHFKRWSTKMQLICRVASLDPHAATTMLRFSGSSSWMSLMRGLGQLPDLWRLVDAEMERTLCRALTITENKIAVLDQAMSPTRLGGLGIPRCFLHAPLANAAALDITMFVLNAEKVHAQPWLRNIITPLALQVLNDNVFADFPLLKNNVLLFWRSRCYIASVAGGHAALDHSMIPGLTELLANNASRAEVPPPTSSESSSLATTSAEASASTPTPTPTSTTSLATAAAAATTAAASPDAAPAAVQAPAADITTITTPRGVRAGKLQTVLTSTLELERQKIRVQQCPNQRERARLLALTARHTGLWLYSSVYTIGPKLWLDKTLFNVAIRLRLGMPIGQQHSRCNLCQNESDALGDHSLTCLNGGHRTGAHGAILDLLMSFAAASAAQPQREPHAIPGSANLRLDVAFSFPRDGSIYLVDVAFTHPLAASNIQHAGPARAATAYEKIKYDKYGEAIKRGRPDAKFVPVIVDTYGGTGASCQPLLKAFCKLRAEHTDTHESTATRILFHRLVFTAVAQAARIASMNAVWFSHIDG